MNELFDGILESKEVNLLLKRFTVKPISLIFYIGFHSGADLSEILGLSPFAFENEKQEISIKSGNVMRKITLPKKVVKEVGKYARERIIGGKNTLWEYNLNQLAAKYQEESFNIIGKPLSWKSVRRTYLAHASKAGLPTELLIANTGVDYKYIQPWLLNGKNYEELLNKTVLYAEEKKG